MSMIETHICNVMMECLVLYLSERDAMLIFMCSRKTRDVYNKKHIKKETEDYKERESILNIRNLWIRTGMFQSARQYAREMFNELMYQQKHKLIDKSCICQIRELFEMCKKIGDSVLLNYPSYASYQHFLRGHIFEEKIIIREKASSSDNHSNEENVCFLIYETLFKIQFFHHTLARRIKQKGCQSKVRFNYIISFKIEGMNAIIKEM